MTKKRKPRIPRIVSDEFLAVVKRGLKKIIDYIQKKENLSSKSLGEESSCEIELPCFRTGGAYRVTPVLLFQWLEICEPKHIIAARDRIILGACLEKFGVIIERSSGKIHFHLYADGARLRFYDLHCLAEK